ncbi:MAG: ABC-F family ATP-binding cassette domain-containing protein [Chitinophagales bacterium]|nr:ABC-F family ATP-binding cassette domain-containing protein [Chitinophagales bacterium]
MVNYLLVESLSKTYDTKVLFSNISFGINKGQKVALIAKNGAGKTSLMKIIMGKDIADSGKITLRKDISIGFLQQDPALDENKTILENIISGDSAMMQAVKMYEEAFINQEHEYTPETSRLLHEASEQMTVLHAWDYELKIKQILSQLKITELDQPVKTLSGGQKKRVALSKILILEPDFLILDEPTNHLDIDMIEWLEEYLTIKNMTILLVTHDRYFLDRVCNQIIELEGGAIYQYKGNFSLFIEKKAHREMVSASELDKVKNSYRRELEWVSRMPKARTTKSKSRLDAFDVIAEKATARKNNDTLKLDVKMTRMGGKILEMIKVSKSFGDIHVLKNFTYLFKRNEKIGIIGKNGIGKTTFLNLVMELEKPDAGKIQSGETIVFGYYAQQGMILKDEKRVIEVVKDIAEFIPLADGSKLSASELLTRFQFAPETQYAYVSKLSGGEKRRLYLMTILIKNPNFLILDEPTNDLDILTLSILEDFLAEFQGCVLIVTHDRYFMDKLVDHVFIFEGDGVIKDFPGNYSDYRVWLEDQKRSQADDQKQITQRAKLPVDEKKVKEGVDLTKRVRMSFKEKHEFAQLEKEIAHLEKEKKKLEETLNDNTVPHDEIFKASEKLVQITETLDEKSMRWLELSEWESS